MRQEPNAQNPPLPGPHFALENALIGAGRNEALEAQQTPAVAQQWFQAAAHEEETKQINYVLGGESRPEVPFFLSQAYSSVPMPNEMDAANSSFTDFAMLGNTGSRPPSIPDMQYASPVESRVGAYVAEPHPPVVGQVTETQPMTGQPMTGVNGDGTHYPSNYQASGYSGHYIGPDPEVGAGATHLPYRGYAT